MKNYALMVHYNVGSSFEGITINITGLFLEPNRQTITSSVIMDYFSKCMEAYACSVKARSHHCS